MDMKYFESKKSGVSKLDFKIENTYIEIKTPLMWLPCAISNMSVFSSSRVILFERFVCHVTELGNCMRNNGNAVMILCFMYDAPQFQIPPMSERNKIIADAVFLAVDSGVKILQMNLGIDKNEVSLIKYFDITGVFENLLERFPNPS